MAAVLALAAGDVDPAAVAAHGHHDHVALLGGGDGSIESGSILADDLAALGVVHGEPVAQHIAEAPAAQRGQQGRQVVQLVLIFLTEHLEHFGEDIGVAARGLFLAGGGFIGDAVEGHRAVILAAGLHHLDVGRIGVAADGVAQAVGVGADDGQFCALFQGQGTVILEQDDRLLGDLLAQVGLLLVGHGGADLLHIHIGMLEQTVLKFDGQDAADRFVQQSFVQLAAPDVIGQLAVGVADRDLGVEAALLGQQTGFFISRSDVEVVVHLHDAGTVAGQHSAELHGVAEQGAGDLLVGTDALAVDLAVVCHHARDIGFVGRRLKGGGKSLVQLPVVDAGDGTVQASLTFGVTEEMLGDAGDALFLLALHPLDIMDTHLADEIGVLAISLIGAAPAGVAGDVDDGAHGTVDTDSPALLPDDRGHLLGQFRLPSGTDVDLGGEEGAARGRITAEVLGLEGHRDAEAGVFDEVMLQVVGDLCDLHRVHDADHRILGEAAVSVGELFGQLLFVYLAFGQHRGGQVAAELCGFFFQRHPAEQVFDTLGDRTAAVLVNLHCFHLSACSIAGVKIGSCCRFSYLLFIK